MNSNKHIVSLRPDNIIDEEASQWLVKLDQGKLSPSDKQAFKQWITADNRHVIALKNMAGIWTELDSLLNEPLTADTTEPAEEQSWSKMFSIAASFSILSISIFLFVFTNTPNSEIYLTQTGQQLQVDLDDGSIAHLNTDSIIEVNFTKQQRTLNLLKGEVLFEVAHDKTRPFVVYAGGQRVQAIGTKFVVHLDDEDISVMVTDGIVQLSKAQLSKTQDKQNDAVVLLNKGEQANIIDNERPKLEKVAQDDLQNKLAWLDGKLIFDNEKLIEVVAEINRYVDANIVLEDEALHDIRVSGRFNLGDTLALIEAIELSLNVHSQQLNDNTILLTK